MSSLIELFAGGGGMALGLESAGFDHHALIERDLDPSRTLLANRPTWNVIRADILNVHSSDFDGVDVVAAGMPRPALVASGETDRDPLLSALLRFVQSIGPKAVIVENVPSVVGARSSWWRSMLTSQLGSNGYDVVERIIGAVDYGIPQNRQRYVAIGLRRDSYSVFHWPVPAAQTQGAGELLKELMGEEGWPGAQSWAARANPVSPAVVGGSTQRGGADLGPSRSRAAWLDFGVDGRSIAALAPPPDFPMNGVPRLTNRMVASLQGFPVSWKFEGSKTAVYRQIASASPPAVMHKLGLAVRSALQPTFDATMETRNNRDQ